MRIGSGGSTGAATKAWEAVGQELTFIGHGVQAGVSAEYPKIQLLNPASSGVIIYLPRMKLYKGNSTLEMVWHDAELATEITTKSSKVSGATGPVGKMFQDTEVALDTPIIWSHVETGPNDEHPFFHNPWVLEEGKGLLIQHNATATTIRVEFEWVEVPI